MRTGLLPACSLSLRGTSGERATKLLVTTPIASKTALLSPALSSLEGRRGRIPAPAVVVLLRCARGEGVQQISLPSAAHKGNFIPLYMHTCFSLAALAAGLTL